MRRLVWVMLWCITCAMLAPEAHIHVEWLLVIASSIIQVPLWWYAHQVYYLLGYDWRRFILLVGHVFWPIRWGECFLVLRCDVYGLRRQAGLAKSTGT